MANHFLCFNLKFHFFVHKIVMANETESLLTPSKHIYLPPDLSLSLSLSLSVLIYRGRAIFSGRATLLLTQNLFLSKTFKVFKKLSIMSLSLFSSSRYISPSISVADEHMANFFLQVTVLAA
jgi:hypothetical protein